MRFREGSVPHVRGVCAGAPLHSSNPAGGGTQRAKRRTRGEACHSVEDLQAREAKGWRLKTLTVEPGLPEQVYGGTGPAGPGKGPLVFVRS